MISKALKFIGKYLRALLRVLFVFLGGFLIKENRDFIASINQQSDRRRKLKLAPSLELPQKTRSDILSKDLPIQLLDPEYKRGNVTLYELYLLNSIIKQYDPKTIFEIGTFDGRTTRNLAVNASSGSKLFTLDLPHEQLSQTKLEVEPSEVEMIAKSRSGVRFIGTEQEKQITQLYGDSAAFDYTPYENSIDLVFIDASHAYEYVLNDSEVALKLLRGSKGIILWHDYGEWDGVTRALNELVSSDGRYAKLVHISGTSLVMLDARED